MIGAIVAMPLGCNCGTIEGVRNALRVLIFSGIFRLDRPGILPYS
jgi:hypothetical protein